jgi:hypothetical protein
VPSRDEPNRDCPQTETDLAIGHRASGSPLVYVSGGWKAHARQIAGLAQAAPDLLTALAGDDRETAEQMPVVSQFEASAPAG